MRRNGPDTSREALERLIQVARGDIGQGRIVANFLLAWWNAAECGGFDLTDVWGVDAAIAVDMLRVFALLAECRQYPDAMGHGEQSEQIVRAWRPALTDRADANPSWGGQDKHERETL